MSCLGYRRRFFAAPPSAVEHGFEAFEFGMAEIEVALATGAGMGLAECLGADPCIERVAVALGQVGGIERVVIGFRSIEEAEAHETRCRVELGAAFGPDPFEICLAPADDAEPVHRDRHGWSSYVCTEKNETGIGYVLAEAKCKTVLTILKGSNCTKRLRAMHSAKMNCLCI